MINSKDLDAEIKREKIKKWVIDIAVYSLLVVWALAVLFPFYYMILTSFKSYGAYNSEFIPKFYTLWQ